MDLDLIILEGSQTGRRLLLGNTPLTFGRSAEAAMSFPHDAYMSGMHLTAHLGPQGVVLTDKRSSNGSFLNGQRITQAVASIGDVIKIGSLTMQVVAAQAAVSEAVLSSPVAPAGGRAQAATTPQQRHEGVLSVLSGAQGSIFCLLDAAADDMILSLLAAAKDSIQVQSLYDGRSAISLAQWAPYLIQFSSGSSLLGILVEKGWGKGWASYFTSNTAFEEVRKHFRKFLMVQIEEGKNVYFRFYDPRVLRDFLSTANSDEVRLFFGPVKDWLVESEDENALLKLRNTSEGLMSVAIHVTDCSSKLGATHPP